MKLNKKQIVVLWLGIVAFILIGSITDTTVMLGNHRLGNSVALTDYGPLVFRLLSVTIVTITLLITLKNR